MSHKIMTNFSSNTDVFVNSNTDAYLNRLLTYFPPEITATFTDEQLNVIKTEFSTLIKNEYCTNPKDSLVFARDNLFCVPTTTPEQNLAKQLPTNRIKHPWLTFTNTLVISTLMFLILTSCFGSLVLIKRKMNINLFPNIDFPDEAVADLLCSAPSR
ncbi:MAG: hypothetical protein F6K16_22295 [Symploca sp. SIO2B6]|nr:hypothetical protein [Symploca sp. SIO2B6]